MECPQCSLSYGRAIARGRWYYCPSCGARVKARKRRSSSSITQAKRLKIYNRDGWICHICKKPVDPKAPLNSEEAASLDHLIPHTLGGRGTYANLALAHRGCNSKRQAKTLDKLGVIRYEGIRSR